ncbi:hypothetical protein Snoj_71710 [Streptomyces nojiriensis]|uniref:ABC transporter permease n=1 Tax=Streptomyces nojiriensis TaxID=66374 RepID=A0ABQ3SYP2_9ACTN|nr:hypothetical protein [Streptomyces nojiriensis]QTI46769.1 hypothetical protein JYK04_04607 [Streptomyces nojiriensis]GGS01216.1 hypothetical protein GCM10010205_32580 [Streptomyces nojiriensis]GHI73253.1 hypothetical protein Snoj_71710 [Streptomyces nojiriensis]
MAGTRRRPARGEGTAWAGELRALWTAPVWGATAAAMLLALALVGRLWMAGAPYGALDPSVSALTSLPSALRASAWQFATLLGLVLTGVVVATGLGQTLEGGTWSALRLFENRVGVLWARKVGAALALSLASQIVTGVLLWLSTSVYARLWPVRPRAVPRVVPPGFADGAVQTSSPLPVEFATWGQAAGAIAAALLVQFLFISLAALAAALLRSVIGTLALGIGPLLVTAPLVLLPAAPFLPHRWIADLLNLPAESQYQLYLWNQAPSDPAPLTAGLALAGVAALAAVAAWAALRSERALRPVD